MSEIKVFTVAVEVEEGDPTTQQVADYVAKIPQLEGEVNVMNSMTISSESHVMAERENIR